MLTSDVFIPQELLNENIHSEDPKPSGDRELRKTIIGVRPILHVFGHAHLGYGVLQTKHTTFVNASLFGRDGSLSNQPIVLEISRFKGH